MALRLGMRIIRLESYFLRSGRNQNKKAKAACGDLKKIDFGVQMGAGLAIPTGSGRLIVDARYAWGLSNVSDVKGDNIKNKGVMLSILKTLRQNRNMYFPIKFSSGIKPYRRESMAISRLSPIIKK